MSAADSAPEVSVPRQGLYDRRSRFRVAGLPRDDCRKDGTARPLGGRIGVLAVCGRDLQGQPAKWAKLAIDSNSGVDSRYKFEAIEARKWKVCKLLPLFRAL